MPAGERLVCEEKQIEIVIMRCCQEIHPSKAEKLVCVRHRVANIGRWKELKITKKTGIIKGSAREASEGCRKAQS